MIFIVLLSGPSHSAIVHNLFLVPIGASFCFIFYFQQTDYKLYKLTVWRNGKFLAEIMRCSTQWGVHEPPLVKQNWNEKTHFFYLLLLISIYVNYLLWKNFYQKFAKYYIFVYFKFHTEKFVQPCMHNELG